MMPNFAYRTALWRGRVIRKNYRSRLESIVRRPVHPSTQIELNVIAYSSEEMLPEQIASIRSLLRYAGRPESLEVVSDGSHSERSLDLLRSIDPVVTIGVLPALPTGSLPAKTVDYLTAHPTGKQLQLIMSLPKRGPTLYLDADVLFFPGASQLAELLERGDAPAWYLADCQFAGDDRLIHAAVEKENPVNTGVLFFRQQLDWSGAMARLEGLEGVPEFHTNQTVTHLAMHANNARRLDPKRYVLALDDQTVFRDRYANPSLVLRHYVNPVRHKFWMNVKS